MLYCNRPWKTNLRAYAVFSKYMERMVVMRTKPPSKSCFTKATRIAVIGLTPSTTQIRNKCHEHPKLNMEFIGSWTPSYRDAVVASTQIVRSKRRHKKGEGVDYPHLEMGLRKDMAAALEHADAVFVVFPYSTVESIVKAVHDNGQPFQLEREDGTWIRFQPNTNTSSIRSQPKSGHGAEQKAQ